MSIIGSAPLLTYQRLSEPDFHLLCHLELVQAERFLEPLATILGFVRHRPAHLLTAVHDAVGLVGFYVLHPDRRDRSCWWLGWLAVDDRQQGRGIGRLVMAAVMAALRRVAGCRRVRLLVAADNAAALRLYAQAGFRAAGTWPETGELMMEHAPAGPAAVRTDAVTVPALTLILAMCLRLWRRGVPPGARMSGEFHGPPARPSTPPCPATPHALHAAA